MPSLPLLPSYICHEKETTLEHLFATPQFWVLFACVVLIYAANSCSTTMADAVCFFLLGNERHKYGHQRLWGSLAFGLVGMTSGGLVNALSHDGQTDWTPACVVVSLFLWLAIAVSWNIKFELPKRDRLSRAAVYNAFCTPKMCVFLVTALVLGTTMGIQWTFLFIFMEDVASAYSAHFAYTKILEGLVVGIDCFFGDVPFFYISGEAFLEPS